MRSSFLLLLMACVAVPLAAQDPEPAQDSLVLADMRRCRMSAADTAAAPAESLLVIARAIRSERWGDSALVCIDGYLAAHGDSGVGLLERARTLFDLHRAEAAREAWIEGARRAGSAAARAQYRADISWIAADSELARFDSLPADSLASWLARFWAARELADARIAGERLTEHYRRWWYVMRNYKGRRARRLRDIGALHRAYRDSVDDRGLVYMRYGEPDERATWNGTVGAADIRNPEAAGEQDLRDLNFEESGSQLNPQALNARTGDALASRIERIDALTLTRPHPNISWRYELPEGPLVLHFVAYRSGHYQLVESLTDAFGYSTGLRLSAGSLNIGDEKLGPRSRRDPLIGLRSLFESRSTIDPLYGAMAVAPSFGRDRRLSEERTRGRQMMVAATSTDRFAQRFDRALRPIVQTFAVGPAPEMDTRGRIVVVFALPGDPLVSGGLKDGRPFYPVRLHVVVSREGRLAGELDTLRQFVTDGALEDGRYITGFAEVPVPPGDYRVQIVLAQALGGAGAALRIESVRVPAAAALSLSDIVVGRRGSGLEWARRGRSVPLNPLNAFTRAAAAELYYEVTGLEAGTEYRTEIELRRAKGGGRAVALAFTERADGAVTPVTRSVDLSPVKPGHYTLIVRIVSPGGARVERSAELYVIEPRSYRDAEDIVARTSPFADPGTGRWTVRFPATRDGRVIVSRDSATARTRHTIGSLVTAKLDGGNAVDISLSASYPGEAPPSTGDSVEVLWLVRGAGAEPHHLVLALEGDRHVDLGTGARRDAAGGPVDEYRMPLAALASLLSAPRAELYLDDQRLELAGKQELRALGTFIEVSRR